MNWLLLSHGPEAAAVNMAWDEALLEAAPGIGHPVLRCYAWREPAASFGYFQKYAAVAALTQLRPLIRRPTGGGLVPHDADWTYSLTVPTKHPWYELRAEASYRAMHEWIQRALSRMGIATDLAAIAHRPAVGQCFVGAERFDVLLQERKIAGAAQRRTRDGLLIQGSIQPPAQAGRGAFERALSAAAPETLGGAGESFVPGEGLRRRVEHLAKLKYESAEYNERR